MDVILQIGTKEVRISAKEFRDLHGLLDKGAAMAEIGTKMAEARKPKSIEITEDEATSLRETASEMEAVQMALEYAMKSAQRRFAELRKQQNDWWEAIGDKYAFDPSRALYEMDKMGSKFLITEKKDSPQQTEATGV